MTAPPSGLVDQVRRTLVGAGKSPTGADVAIALRRSWTLQPDQQVLAEVGAVRAELIGAGPLQPLLDDPEITDVLVQGGGEVWVDRGHGPVRATVKLGGETAIRQLATRMVAAAGRRLDAAHPYADAVLPDGHRLHAVLPPVAVDGTTISLRAHPPGGFDLAELQARGSLIGPTRAWLETLLGAGLAAVVTGATGAGKTTLLSALVSALPAELRVLLVEDETELRAKHPQLVRLQARQANVEGAGEVGLRDLVRQALRMRPDRLVLGEVRGPEVLDLLTALNTGHEGGLATVHANSPGELPARVEALGALGGLPRSAVHSLLAPAVQVVLHVSRTGAQRRLTEIAVLCTDVAGQVSCRPALQLGSGLLEPGPALRQLRELLKARGSDPPLLPT